MSPTHGLALLCDTDGSLVQTLSDKIGMGDRLRVGVPFPSLVLPGSLVKALSFVDELRRRGTAFDWEIDLLVEEQVKRLHFSGGRVNELLLILGVENEPAAKKLRKELIGINNEQTNILRNTLKAKNRDDGLYNDISRLNNEVMAAQRELARMNFELEKRVTERTRELKETQEKLVRQEKLAVLGQMAGSVGHELRNPLSVITNAIYMLQLTQAEANPQVKEYLGIIDEETKNAGKIITDLLDFARPGTGDRLVISVSELVRQTLERFPTPATVELVLDLPAHLPPVYADPRQMVQVLGNLTINACQAMPKGGQLTISARPEEGMVAVAVKDTGVGIPPEFMDKLFEPLFTTKPKGVGLGLAISRKLAEANEGRIEVQSEPGKGSVFTVYLQSNPQTLYVESHPSS